MHAIHTLRYEKTQDDREISRTKVSKVHIYTDCEYYEYSTHWYIVFIEEFLRTLETNNEYKENYPRILTNEMKFFLFIFFCNDVE